MMSLSFPTNLSSNYILRHAEGIENHKLDIYWLILVKNRM